MRSASSLNFLNVMVSYTRYLVLFGCIEHSPAYAYDQFVDVRGADGAHSINGSGEQGESISLSFTTSTDSSFYLRTFGGSGGNGLTMGGKGGDSSSLLSMTNNGASILPFVTTEAYGGIGGKSTLGNGGNGGQSIAATLIQNNSLNPVNVSARSQSYGGNGGDGSGIGNTGGAAGMAISSSHVTGTNLQAVEVSASQIGGNGGNGSNGASGADGADSSMLNAVSISAPANNIVMNQSAYGGNGGSSDIGIAGHGGNANSILELLNYVSTDRISAEVSAVAGKSGAAQAATATDGNAVASLKLNGEARLLYGTVVARSTNAANTGTGNAIANAKVVGKEAEIVSARAMSFGATGYARASASQLSDTGSSITTSAVASNIMGYSGDLSATVGELAPGSGGTSISAQFENSGRTALGTANGDFQVFGFGFVHASSIVSNGIIPFDDNRVYTTSASASYRFSPPMLGRSLFLHFERLPDEFGFQFGDGFTNATLTVSMDGSAIMESHFASFLDFSHFIETPTNLGSVDEATMVEIALTHRFAGLDNGYRSLFMLAMADLTDITGLYRTASLSNVPLPSSLPMFAASLCVFARRIRKRKCKREDISLVTA